MKKAVMRDIENDDHEIVRSNFYHPVQPLCSSVEDFQHFGGIPSILWRDTINIVEGYHQYFGEAPLILWMIFSAVEGSHTHCVGYI